MAKTTTKATLTFPAPALAPFPDVQVFPKHRSDHAEPEFDSDDDASDVEDSEFFNAEDIFTVDEDLFLVRNWCFQPEMTLDEIGIQFRREFQDERSASDLERRLQVVQSDELQPLLSLYLKAIVVDREMSGGYAGNATSIKPPFLPLLRRLRPSCETTLLQLIYEDEKLATETSDTIPVDVSSRNFPKYSRLIDKRQLARCSKEIRDLFNAVEHGSKVSMSPHQAFSLHGGNHGTERLVFTDGVPFYDSCMVFNHLEQPIFDRLLLFAKDPNVSERLTLQKQQLVEQKQIKRELTHQIRSIFSSQQKLHIEKLEMARSFECVSITEHLEKILEQDIQHLRRMHETLLRHEHAKIHAKFDEQIAKLNRHISATKNAVNALQQKMDYNGWTTLDQDIACSRLQVERIFGTSDYILRLLILAEDLDAEPLRRALVRYLSKENALPQFALRREFTSKMISESTVLAILDGAPTRDLRELEAEGKNFVHHELVAREIHTRKVTFSRFIAGLTNDQLRVVSRIKSDGLQSVLDAADEEFIDADMLAEMKAVVDFSDVLDRELARRREFSCVRMDSANSDREVSFSEDDCVLQLEASHRYCSVFATKGRRQGESGKWIFEASVEVFAGEGESILLGWEIPRTETATTSGNTPTLITLFPPSSDSLAMASRSFVPGLTTGSDGRSYGVTWQSDGGLDMGMLHANGQSKSGVASFRAGDVIGCTINQDELVPYLRFFLNGVQVIPSTAVTSTTASTASPSTTGVACHNPVYCLFPVVSMYSSRKKPQMRVRFNFRGNFRFPIAGFEPYGAPL